MSGSGIEVSLDYSSAILGDRDVTEDEQREAGIRLAERALIAAGGDEEAAKPMLREVLEAAGFIPYETAARYQYGRPKPPGKGGGQ